MSVSPPSTAKPVSARDDEIHFAELINAVRQRWRLIAVGSLLCGGLAAGATFLMTPIFSAQASFLSPQQQQNAAASALASIGALSGLAGAGIVKSPADQYVTLMQSNVVLDRIIDRFKLMDVYETKFRMDARKRLQNSLRVAAGKKDNLIAVEVDDTDPQRAADIANALIEELRGLTNSLALTEAQQRRVFFEQQLAATRDRLGNAQLKLQSSGINAGALKAEPKSAADSYSRLRAEIAAAEIRIQTLQRTLTSQAPEVQQQMAALSAMRGQLAKLEEPESARGSTDYVGAYREYKYQEAIFDIYAKQFELAKLDEAREGTLFQVVDKATAPERRSKPKRAQTTLIGTFGALFLLTGWVVLSFIFGSRGEKGRQ